ncbi:Uncharacterized protein FKW44_025096 [Caligus rogercresseyi]|uniref:Condensin complex subunit 1 N-terminal domain-containing protein n=1 Tax=Caligus rogercresseyi TaxID=217165 RepID=A0A7T8JTB8_CALRO|nr:Uncharacterized protein FKW44_025096 [Caligus rogercresseyi]
MKMIVYLITQLSELLERESIERQSLLTGKKKKDSEESISWEESRLKTLHFMYIILQLSLHRVFDPPVAEEDFINCFANAAFRTLENPIMAHVRYKNVRLSVYQILGSLNARFDYSLSCSFNLVQELKLFEHMVSPLAEAVEVFFREYGCRSIVMEVIQEISRLDSKELSRDASATKSYSSFLLEITERLPDSVKPSLSLLIHHLDGESYMMRKCILNILGEIVMRVLSKEDLDDISKENRSQFLEYLEDYIHDSNAHVRSSVLAMWSKLCVAKAIPLSRQNSVLKRTLGRLQDKSSNVRKQAVTLLTSLLQCNPYTFSLPIEELESQLSEENKKYEELEAAASKGQDIKKWDDEAIARSHRWDIYDDEDFDEDEDIYGGIKSFFEVSPLPGPEDESLGKQRILVAYLKDSVSFGCLMNDSLPCMCQLLASKQVSDILEAIDFFVTAFEFGLLNAMMGVRRMLSLIWSQEAVVKDAVVKAYKRLFIDVGSSSGGSLQVVKNLIVLVRGATLGECASLEALVGLLVDSRDIQKDCYTILWQIFTHVMPDTSEESACDALLLIGMIALKEPSVVSSNIPILVEHAFGPRGHKSFRLVTEACKALMKIVPPFKSDSLETPHRFDEDDPLFESLHKILVQGMSSKERFDYIPMAKAAITVIYDLSEHPDRRMGMIAKELMIGKELIG